MLQEPLQEKLSQASSAAKWPLGPGYRTVNKINEGYNEDNGTDVLGPLENKVIGS